MLGNHAQSVHIFEKLTNRRLFLDTTLRQIVVFCDFAPGLDNGAGCRGLNKTPHVRLHSKCLSWAQCIPIFKKVHSVCKGDAIRVASIQMPRSAHLGFCLATTLAYFSYTYLLFDIWLRMQISQICHGTVLSFAFHVHWTSKSIPMQFRSLPL